jgi:hypothetical protein
MSNFNTVTPTNESEEGDLYLLGRGTTSRTQKREIVAAGIANARWSSEAVYLAGSNTVGSDGVNYQAVTDSGAGTPAGVIDPTTDNLETHWVKFVNYKESGGLVKGDIETNSFVKTPEIKVTKIINIDGTETTPVEIPSLENRMAIAWVSFNGKGVPSIINHKNVSTVTSNATGDYTITFKVPLPNDKYTVVTSGRYKVGDTGTDTMQGEQVSPNGQTTTTLRIAAGRSREGYFDGNDLELVNVVIFSG